MDWLHVRHRPPYLLTNNTLHACTRCAQLSANDSLWCVHVSSKMVVDDVMCNPSIHMGPSDRNVHALFVRGFSHQADGYRSRSPNPNRGFERARTVDLTPKMAKARWCENVSLACTIFKGDNLLLVFFMWKCKYCALDAVCQYCASVIQFQRLWGMPTIPSLLYHWLPCCCSSGHISRRCCFGRPRSLRTNGTHWPHPKCDSHPVPEPFILVGVDERIDAGVAKSQHDGEVVRERREGHRGSKVEGQEDGLVWKPTCRVG